jgi:hypothetical protein
MGIKSKKRKLKIENENENETLIVAWTEMILLWKNYLQLSVAKLKIMNELEHQIKKRKLKIENENENFIVAWTEMNLWWKNYLQLSVAMLKIKNLHGHQIKKKKIKNIKRKLDRCLNWNDSLIKKLSSIEYCKVKNKEWTWTSNQKKRKIKN